MASGLQPAGALRMRAEAHTPAEPAKPPHFAIPLPFRIIPAMLRRAIIFFAIAVYIVVVGCVLVPAGEKSGSSTHGASTVGYIGAQGPMKGLPLVSVTMQLQRTDWIDKYEQNIDEIAALGADTVQFVVDPRQENASSERIYLDMRMTPTAEQLTRLIKHAKDKGLRVTLMPIVLLDNPEGNDWRGTIHPKDWHEWFDSYRNIMQTYAWIAEGNHVDLLVVGSELVSAEKHLDEWDHTIELIRETYHGKLTYSSNWDHYRSVEFWNKLDLIGMNSYWSFGEEKSDPNPSLDHIVDRWHEIQEDLFAFQKKVKKPIIFLEIGWFSQQNVAYEPWDYTKDEAVDVELQKKLYEGFFKVWWGDPRLGGFSVWEWPPDAGGKEDGGYTPKGKPAEDVLKDYFAKPRWEVK